jgi:NADH-quinone oxidoreductase subunit L
MDWIAWFLLLAPLLSAVSILVYLHRKPWEAVFASVGSAAICFFIAIAVACGSIGEPTPWTWFSFPGLQIEIGMILDPLSKGMLLVVTGVGLLVHIFSIRYMEHDPGRARFFGGLSIFMFSMTGIVLASNLVMMFLFWEGVGLSSYLLIGFWYTRESAAQAANKAFVCNRLADFGFIVGILTFWMIMGTVSVHPADLAHAYQQGAGYQVHEVVSQEGAAATHNGVLPIGLSRISPAWLTVMVLGIFAGCVGKSAMFPLHVWLPDAMEGPTPVSALIHAATMVAAGVYLLCRTYPLLLLSPSGLFLIALCGSFTSIFAALIAIQQNDIKRILAYSTLSQLGYMVMAVGCGGPGAAMFHLTTHAFFKALLFLAAGSVIHALHEEQDIWRMGGLAKRIPLTFWTFFIGMLALSGVPPLAGYFSKDFILATAYAYNPLFYWVGVFTAFLTAFYMTRLVVIAFLGEPRTEAAEHPHESPPSMTVPLILLAILSVVGGWAVLGLGLRAYYTGWFTETLIGIGWLPAGSGAMELPEASIFITFIVPIFMVAAGLAGGWFLYRDRKEDPLHLDLLAHKFYIDEFYDNWIVACQQHVADAFAWIDAWILDGAIIRGGAYLSVGVGELLKLIQTGNLQTYAFLFSLGGGLLIYFTLFYHP